MNNKNMYHAFSYSVIGKSNNTNDDSLYYSKEKSIFVVADGVGSLKNSKKASQTICNMFERKFPLTINANNICSVINKFIYTIHKKIYNYSYRLLFKDKVISSTVTALYIKNENFYVFNAGDSRCYLIRNNNIHNITKDHLNEFGELTNAMGIYKELKIDVYSGKIQDNDIFLLLTDGIYNNIKEEDIISLFNVREFQKKTYHKRKNDKSNQHSSNQQNIESNHNQEDQYSSNQKNIESNHNQEDQYSSNQHNIESNHNQENQHSSNQHKNIETNTSKHTENSFLSQDNFTKLINDYLAKHPNYDDATIIFVQIDNTSISQQNANNDIIDYKTTFHNKIKVTNKFFKLFLSFLFMSIIIYYLLVIKVNSAHPVKINLNVDSGYLIVNEKIKIDISETNELELLLPYGYTTIKYYINQSDTDYTDKVKILVRNQNNSFDIYFTEK